MKPLTEFKKHKEMKDGYLSYCNQCGAEKQRKYRLLTNDIHTKRYEKTEKGYLMRTYRNMKSRVFGILKRKLHLYYGKEILGKEEFYRWALNNTNFKELFAEYEKSGYDLKLAPSIDRIDSTKGYTIDNMRWLTHSENSRLGCYSRYKTQAA
jgi:hypothetical protein